MPDMYDKQEMLEIYNSFDKIYKLQKFIQQEKERKLHTMYKSPTLSLNEVVHSAPF